MQWLTHFDINREFDHEPVHIHASGHASGVELLEFARMIEPETVIPIHTECPEIFQQELAESGIRVVLPVEGEAIGF